jgi:hypothetical protein
MGLRRIVMSLKVKLWFINLGEIFSSGPRFEPGSSPGDQGSNPGPDENFSHKLTTQDLSKGYSEELNFHHNLPICVINMKTPN